MAGFEPISFENFANVIPYLDKTKSTDKEFCYAIYCFTVEGISDLVENNIFSNLQGINHLELIGYCVGECNYFTFGVKEEEIDNFKKDENVIQSISSIVADKYLTLSHFSHSQESIANRFAPPFSTLYVYVNFMLNIVQNYNKKDPRVSLIADLFMKSISIVKCTLDLLVKGFETEAFSCWRTLHECECALIVLLKDNNDVIKAYLKHLEYALAFKDTMADKDKQTQIFMSMKEEMKQYDLKSKDIKKYIEYGWLYTVKGVKEDPEFKLNFRDGLEKVAGLTNYAKRYEMSSEIIHGTPLLIYSNRTYFYYLTLLSTYESFFRFESIFSTMFSRNVNKEQFDSYLGMRKIYFTHLSTIYQRESAAFTKWSEANDK